MGVDEVCNNAFEAADDAAVDHDRSLGELVGVKVGQAELRGLVVFELDGLEKWHDAARADARRHFAAARGHATILPGTQTHGQSAFTPQRATDLRSTLRCLQRSSLSHLTESASEVATERRRPSLDECSLW